MSTLIGIVLLLGFAFLGLQYGMKVDIIGFVKTKILKK